MKPDDLISAATAFYLGSRDFNGYPGHMIHREHNLTYDTIRELFFKLVEDGRGAIILGDNHPNPHIRAFADEPRESQLKKLKSAPIEQACLYPSAEHLAVVVKKKDYQDRPFSRKLALGSGQLEFRAFDLSVLETYRNDPRYHYVNNDISGNICVTDEFYESDQMHDRDQVILQTFGFAYDDNMTRAVAVFLKYLSNLSPEHQQIWRTKLLAGKFRLHPDYYKGCILGDWELGISVFEAFIEELKIIKNMCAAMGRPSLFRKTFEDPRPPNFSFLVRPTQEEFNSFVHTLDKMMSENINKKFFKKEVSHEMEQEREDGKIVVLPMGTIAMFDEWIKARFRIEDTKYIDDIITTFKRVRNLRQKPAHIITQNIFDQRFFHKQQQLIIEAYNGIKTIRLMFASHPAVKAVSVYIPEVLDEGKIWTQ